MDKFYVISNSDKHESITTANKIKDFIVAGGKQCILDFGSVSDGRSQIGYPADYKYTDPDKIPKDIECILVLGGDGTFIQAANDLMSINIPLMGINLGTLGFLAEVEKSSIESTLEKLMNDEYQIESRMMIDGEVQHKGQSVAKGTALNEIVISRTGTLRIIDFKIYVNGKFLNLYSADGIIISTPTGSTAYNLSAGGPIVDPSANITVITPICPHTLNTRSIVLSADSHIEIELCSERKGVEEGRVVCFDGSDSIDLFYMDKVSIYKSNVDTKIIKLSNVSFLEVLRQKMSNK